MAEPLSRKPSLVSRFVRKVLVWFYRARGWKAVGKPPADRRCVIIAVPHTSNWDFFNFLGTTDAVKIRPHFMAKHTLFRWPIGRFLLDMGGVPVDRGSSQNYVDQMVDEFARRKEFMLTIAPEGTRKAVTKWKTGFYHIAVKAKVPLICGLMDYKNKVGGLGPMIIPTGDYRADMEKIVEFYRNANPKNPENVIAEQAVLSADDDMRK